MIVQEPDFQLKEINPKFKTITKNEIVENTKNDNPPKMTETIPYHAGLEYNQPGFNFSLKEPAIQRNYENVRFTNDCSRTWLPIERD